MKARVKICHLDVEEDIGRRNYMEDCHFVQDVNDRFFIALVCDGHGGAKAARFLSLAFQESVQILFKQNLNQLDISLVLTRFVDLLGPKFAQQFPKASDGTTLCGVLVDKYYKSVTLFNLGDSQAFLYQKRSAKPILATRLHTTDDPKERKRLEKLGFECIQDDEDGTWRLHELNMSRAFGNYGNTRLNCALTKTNGRTIEIQSYTILHDKISVILGTDGLFDVLEGEKNLSLFQKTSSRELIDIVNKGKKGDNVTIIKFNIKDTSE